MLGHPSVEQVQHGVCRSLLKSELILTLSSTQYSFSSLQQDMKRGAENQLRKGDEESEEFESSSEVRVDHASQAMLSNQSVHLAVTGTGLSKSS